MEKDWIPEKNIIDSANAVIKNFIYLSQTKVSRYTIEKYTKAHPEYPSLSLGAIGSLLERWGLESLIYSCKSEHLDQLPKPSILLLRRHFEDDKEVEYVILFNTQRTEVEYLHCKDGWTIENKKTFLKKWAKIGLSLISSQNFQEKNFSALERRYEKRLKEKRKKHEIYTIENFLTREECKYIIKISRKRFVRSKVVVDGKPNVVDGRTSYSAFLDSLNDTKLLKIRIRAAQLLKHPLTHIEELQVVSYEKGQQYQIHHDAFTNKSISEKGKIEKNGQRVYTVLVYLNDDFFGGSTFFPSLEYKIQPKEGKALVFRNVTKLRRIIKAANHCGLPVTKGRKYALNIWIRDRPFLRGNSIN